jgi:type III secretion protein J
MPKMRVLFGMLASLFLLSACQTEIYSNLSEREANEMLTALMDVGIDASKTTIGEESFGVEVANEDVREALAVLNAQGLPQNNRQSIGQVFAKSGIVSSPFEERVRYIYALGEEVAQTLQQIDGVLVARVHIVMPEAPELGQEAKPSSAAVFIKQKVGFDLDFLVPQIRRLVANSIEGVRYEEVSVVLVEAQPQSQSPSESTEVSDVVEALPGLRVAAASSSTFWLLIGAATLVFSGLAAGIIYLLRWNAGLRAKLAGADQADT